MSTVSIIIPSYNAAAILGETIESALCQTHRDTEIIIVDDGSTDDTRRVIESFGSRVRAEFGPNRGASAARNRGTALARGEFLQYLDADDLLERDAVAARVKALKSSRADVAYSDWQRLIEQADGRYAKGAAVTRTIEQVHPYPAIAALTDFWAPPAALLYRRAIVESIGGWNESLPVIQDARLLLDAALHGGKFVHVAGIGAYYRIARNESLSRRDAVEFVRDCLRNATQVEAWWQQRGGVTSAQRHALVQVYGHIARSSFENDRPTFEEAYRALERLQPGYRPSRPKRLAVMSRLVGYRRAESIALLYRKAKRCACFARPANR
jgi:glycosyltransferase involved in cell wall biosynthesis